MPDPTRPKMSLFALLTAPLLVVSQLIGDAVPEEHPPLTWSRCTSSGSCADVSGSVVLDAEHRWLRLNGTWENCYYGGTRWTGGGTWDNCDSNADCTAKCALEGADSTYDRQMDFEDKLIRMRYYQYADFSEYMNTRVFLMESEGEEKYEMFELLGNELSFEVDLASVPCGLNAALRFVAMDQDGGMGRYEGQKAGARYGTGYCDASCPRSLRWVAGEANMEGWMPSEYDPTGGEGNRGACCSEMAVWNSNSISYALDSRPCKQHEYEPCYEDVCDPERYGNDIRNRNCARNGCETNPYRIGNPDFYGPDKVVNTSAPFTVITQFRESGIKQFFIQDGKKIEPPAPSWEGLPNAEGGINEEYCYAAPDVFAERDVFNEVGGWEQHNDALRRPTVLTMSIQDDYWAYNLWLDGEAYPTDADPTLPGYKRGTCGLEESDPYWVASNKRNAAVSFSNIKFGPIGSTVDVE